MSQETAMSVEGWLCKIHRPNIRNCYGNLCKW